MIQPQAMSHMAMQPFPGYSMGHFFAQPFPMNGMPMNPMQMDQMMPPFANPMMGMNQSQMGTLEHPRSPKEMLRQEILEKKGSNDIHLTKLREISDEQISTLLSNQELLDQWLTQE